MQPTFICQKGLILDIGLADDRFEVNVKIMMND